MIKLIVDKIPRIIKNRKRLEKDLKAIIKNRGKEVYIQSSPEDEYIIEKVIKALDMGFPYSTAIMIKKNDLQFEILNLKDYARNKNIESVKGRLIGTQGKTLRILTELTNCAFEIKDNLVGIIGEPDEIKYAQESIILIAKGSKPGNVYGHLSRIKSKLPKDIDLGLK